MYFERIERRRQIQERLISLRGETGGKLRQDIVIMIIIIIITIILRFAQLLIVLKLVSSLAPGNNKLPRKAKKHPMIAFSLLSTSSAPF